MPHMPGQQINPLLLLLLLLFLMGDMNQIDPLLLILLILLLCGGFPTMGMAEGE